MDSEVGIVVWGSLLIIIVGIMIPLIITGLELNASTDDLGFILGPTVNLIENGVSFFTFQINTIPTTWREPIVTYLTAWGVIPTPITVILLVPTLLGIIYAFIKLLPTT